MIWSESLQSLLKTVDHVFFYPNALPRIWLWSILRPGPGHTTNSFTDLSHGRGICDIKDIEALSASFKMLVTALMSKVTIEVCESLRPGSGSKPWLQVDASMLIVNAVRSTRTPFMLLSERSAPVTDSFIVIVGFRAGMFVAVWDEKPPGHRLDSIVCDIPYFTERRGVSFLNAPICFMSPAPTTGSELAVNAIVLRLRVSSTIDPGELSTPISFDFKPEYWLVQTAHVPPLVRCTVCLGAIRDRKFIFAGSSKHDNSTIQGGGKHCDGCNNPDDENNWSGRFLICELCCDIRIPPMPSMPVPQETTDTSMQSEVREMRGRRDLFPSISLPVQSSLHRCFHDVVKVPNRVQDVVWTILHPQEFMKGAQFFLDFTLSATWLHALAPKMIVDAQRLNPVLVWDAFFRVYVRNSHCNRAKLSLFAIQFALNLTGMFKPNGKQHNREVFFVPELPFDRRIEKVITQRVTHLTELANGLVRGEVLAWMARRLVKYLDGDMWGQVLYCSCSDGHSALGSDDYRVGQKRTRCDGPSLDLSLDGGVEERLSWGAFNARTSNQVRRLREFQVHLKRISQDTNKQFIPGVHVRLPK